MPSDPQHKTTIRRRSMRDVGGINSPDVVPPLAVLAQAICLVDCAKRGFAGCTFDGLVCLDRPGVEQEAREALNHVR